MNLSCHGHKTATERVIQDRATNSLAMCDITCRRQKFQGLKAILATEGPGRGVIDHPVPRPHAAQWGGLAMVDLAEPLRPADGDMIGRGDSDPDLRRTGWVGYRYLYQQSQFLPHPS